MAKLTATQEQALLLLASGETVTRTAEVVGVSRQTCSEWVNRDPDFIATLNTLRQETLDAGADRLRNMVGAALDAAAARQAVTLLAVTNPGRTEPATKKAHSAPQRRRILQSVSVAGARVRE